MPGDLIKANSRKVLQSGFSLHLLRVLEYLSFSHSALSPSSAGFLTQAHLSVHLALTHSFL